jgi:hypothetical protein
MNHRNHTEVPREGVQVNKQAPKTPKTSFSKCVVEVLKQLEDESPHTLRANCNRC